MSNLDLPHDHLYDQPASPNTDLPAAEMTLQQQQDFASHEPMMNESCLVQIYPPDVIDGMLLLENDVLRIGRDFDSDLALHDANVSRRHAEIVRRKNGFLLRDMGSTNGTFVNGQKVESLPLHPGDQIAIGPFMFKYLSAGCIEAHYHETVYTSLTRDALTGAANKRYLLESMQREIARCRRDKQALAVVMMDIDHFKSVNDTHGHLAGDEVLREFGKRLIRISRADDMFARYGGEEFCLMLSSTDRSEALEIAERCREEIASRPFSTEAGELDITSSFGIYVYTGEQEASTEALIGYADQQLYHAKRNGRNRVACGN